MFRKLILEKSDQRENFKANRYTQGVLNIIRNIADQALAKQRPLPDDGRFKGPPFIPPSPGKQPARPEKGHSKLSWLIIILIILFVVLPLVFCCCCIYFCCCRNKGFVE